MTTYHCLCTAEAKLVVGGSMSAEIYRVVCSNPDCTYLRPQTGWHRSEDVARDKFAAELKRIMGRIEGKR